MWSYCMLLVATVAATALGAAHPHAALRDAASAPAPPQLKVVQPRDLGGGGEPTCEELKAMWRFSKRQARAPEIMNEISTYRDPFTYNEWNPYYTQTPRSRGGTRGWTTGTKHYTVPNKVVYGTMVMKVPAGLAGGAPTPYDQVANVYGVLQPDANSMPKSSGAYLRSGGGVRPPSQRLQHSGRFSHLKELVQIERARELQEQLTAEKQAARRAAAYRTASGRPDDYQRYHSNSFQNMDFLQDDSPSADEPAPAPAPRQGYTNRHRQQPVTGYLRHSNHDNSKYPEMTPRERRADLLPELDDLTYYHQPWDLAYDGGNFAPVYGGSYEMPNHLMEKAAYMNVPEYFETEESG